MATTTVCMAAVIGAVACLISAALAQVDPPGFVNSGKTYPKMPKEFAATTLQQKYNSNGGNVNHTCAGAYYSSYSKMKIRSDCIGFPLTNKTAGSNGSAVPLGAQFGSVIMGVMDFTVNPPTTTQAQIVGIYEAPKCHVYGTSWLPPMAPDFLKTMRAVFRGVVPDPNVRGRDLEQWSFVALGTTAFDFYFDTTFRRFVGYAFSNTGSGAAGEQADVAVYTQFINAWGADDPDFFPDSLFNTTCV